MNTEKYMNDYYWIKMVDSGFYMIAEKIDDERFMMIGNDNCIATKDFEVVEKVKGLSKVKRVAHEL